MSSASTTPTSTTTPSHSTSITFSADSSADEKGRFLLLHKEMIYNKDAPNNLSLPSMDHVLKNIESYQNEQQLSDSQLLLEFNQRNSQSSEHVQTSPEQDSNTISQYQQQYTFQQRSESTNSIEAFQNELKQEQQHHHQPIPHHSLSQPQIPTTKSQQRPSHIHRNSTSNAITSLKRSTTPLSINTMDDDYDSRDSSVDSGLDSPNLTPNGSNNKKRTNLPRETIEILNEWILNNMDNPYPNHTQKRLLLEQTGLSNVQLSNWFINKRRRRLFSNLSGNNGQPIKKKRLIDRL